MDVKRENNLEKYRKRTKRAKIGAVIVGTAILIGSLFGRFSADSKEPYYAVVKENERIVAAGKGIIFIKDDLEVPFVLPMGFGADTKIIENTTFEFMDCPAPYEYQGSCKETANGLSCSFTCSEPTASPPTQASPTPTPTPVPTGKVVLLGTSGVSMQINDQIGGCEGGKCASRCTNGFKAYRSDGTAVLVSNAHCATRTHAMRFPGYKCCAGDDWVSPGTMDGGTAQDIIGETWYWFPHDVYEGYKANYDAAVIKLFDPNSVKNEIVGLGEVSGIAPVGDNTKVMKVGATTGLTYGIVTSPSACVKMLAANGVVVVFCQQYVIEAERDANGNFKPYMLGGDSGSLTVLRENTPTKKAVCLGFAGSANGQYAICSPINLVLAGLHVTLTK